MDTFPAPRPWRRSHGDWSWRKRCRRLVAECRSLSHRDSVSPAPKMPDSLVPAVVKLPSEVVEDPHRKNCRTLDALSPGTAGTHGRHPPHPASSSSSPCPALQSSFLPSPALSFPVPGPGPPCGAPPLCAGSRGGARHKAEDAPELVRAMVARTSSTRRCIRTKCIGSRTGQRTEPASSISKSEESPLGCGLFAKLTSRFTVQIWQIWGRRGGWSRFIGVALHQLTQIPKIRIGGLAGLKGWRGATVLPFAPSERFPMRC